MEDSFPETVALPELIYKIGEEPFNPSLKINKFYNKKNIVNNLEDIVGPALFERLRASFLGPILKTINRNLELSGKLLHYILTRNLVTKKQNELWFNFGGQPMRFSIREFHMVTGLKCSGDVTVGSNNGVMKWRDLETKKHTLDQLLQKLRSLESDASQDKYCLAMLFVIESLFMTQYTGCYYDIDSVMIAKDVDKLNNYPWGRKAYKILLESVKFNIRSSLQKETYSIAGFPLALHLWIVQSIPVFQSSFSHIDKQWSGFICERFLQLDAPSQEPIRKLQTDNVSMNSVFVLYSVNFGRNNTYLGKFWKGFGKDNKGLGKPFLKYFVNLFLGKF